MSYRKTHKGEVSLLMAAGIGALGIWVYNIYKDKVRVGVSGVDGRGIITNDQIDKGDVLGVMKNGSLTKIGENTNHSKANNAKIEQRGDKFTLVSTQPIKDNEEVFIDYEMNPIGFSTDIRGFQ